KLVNHKGQPVSGADLRLIVAADRPAGREAYPFNWEMIETNQIEQVASVLQVGRMTTKADGSFHFDGIQGDADVELVYWAKGIAPGRMANLHTLTAAERTAGIEVKALAPSRIDGTIDRGAFPAFESITLSGANRFWQVKRSADGKSFVFDDLPPGKYEVQIYS